jgi:replication factor A1
MKISELNAGMNDINIKAKVASISQPRAVQTKYGPNTVADVTLEDESGKITLTLWGKQISSVKQGDAVEVKGAYIKEWNGELQIGVGKTGEINVV